MAVGDEAEAALNPDPSYTPELRMVILRTFLESYDTYVQAVRLQM